MRNGRLGVIVSVALLACGSTSSTGWAMDPAEAARLQAERQKNYESGRRLEQKRIEAERTNRRSGMFADPNVVNAPGYDKKNGPALPPKLRQPAREDANNNNAAAIDEQEEKAGNQAKIGNGADLSAQAREEAKAKGEARTQEDVANKRSGMISAPNAGYNQQNRPAPPPKLRQPADEDANNNNAVANVNTRARSTTICINCSDVNPQTLPKIDHDDN